MSIGEQIKRLRTSKKMTQSELSNRINVTKATISAYENGTRQPSYDILIKIAAFFNVSTDYLLGLEKPSVNYEGLSDREIRAIMNIVDVLREK